MTNKDFYAFCRDRRKVEYDAARCEALTDVYNYMRECGVTKNGVATYIWHRMDRVDVTLKEAYHWLLDKFEGNIHIRPECICGRYAGETGSAEWTCPAHGKCSTSTFTGYLL